MQLIDTHVHINFDVFQSDIEAVRERWQAAGVVHLIHSCVEPSEFSGIQAIAHRFPEVSYAVGLHPLDAEQWNEKTSVEIFSWARSDSKVVAIGETGLDFYKATNYEQQLIAFETQLEIATELKLPVIVHCRDAASELKQVLQKWKNIKGDSVRGVMHCWGGNPEETQWFLDLGFYISFSGTVTFKNAKQIQESAAMVRSDRLLVETDCPFLAPVPKRGERRNEPAYVRYVAEQVAKLRGETLSEIASLTTRNACELFGLTL
ncbi:MULTISPECIES: TatD family hydrolase [Nostocales]|uniref:D-aminoacyl-tRNA deacylase n=3 Tax=Nostocales TaxID=1161 RepID=A0A0C1QWL6_9CYAN|nr:TatD family hydrolase [Tolypothrix bouteillei]KAF3891175.1 TatD family hydrolase [Tolypothrix bouteillei VB521301]